MKIFSILVDKTEALHKQTSLHTSKVEGRRVTEPKVALLKAAKHNHVVDAD